MPDITCIAFITVVTGFVGFEDKTWTVKHVVAAVQQQFNDLGQEEIFSSGFITAFWAKD